jgi:hypothetical protein
MWIIALLILVFCFVALGLVVAFIFFAMLIGMLSGGNDQKQ